MKKLLSTLLALAMMATLPAGAMAEPQSATASAMGFGGMIEVTVTMDNGVITAVEAVGSKESQGIGSIAVETLPGKMVEANSTTVDAVAGATVSSTAIMTAAQAAVNQLNGVAEEEKKMTPGTYTSEAKGFYSDIRAIVTVSEDAIEDVVIENTIVYENTSTNTAKDGVASETFNDGTLGFGSVANVELAQAHCGGADGGLRRHYRPNTSAVCFSRICRSVFRNIC